jgi:hypothetical protein
VFAAALLLLASAPPADATGVTKNDFESAVEVCDTWLSKPWIWVDHVSSFPKRSGFDAIGLKQTVEIPAYARAMAMPGTGNPSFWRLDRGGSTFWIITADSSPICNIAIGDSATAAPAAEQLVMNYHHKSGWTYAGKSGPQAGVLSFSFERAKAGTVPKTLLTVSAPERLSPTGDGLQVLATLNFELEE